MVNVRNWNRLHFRIKQIVEAQNGKKVSEHVLLYAAGDEL